MRFRDRSDAGRKLARALDRYKLEKPIVLALPRGGVPVAAEVAAAFDAPLDIVLVRKIGAPMQPELALGAVVDGGEPVVVRNARVIESTATTEQEFQGICREAMSEIERRRKLYAGTHKPLDPRGRVTIVIDDGMATGATMRAALRAVRVRSPKKLVLAVPVAPHQCLENLRGEVDDIVCLTDLGSYGAISYFYDNFEQVTDDGVIALLGRSPAPVTHEATAAGTQADRVRRILGDIDDAKVAEILSLQPSDADLERAAMWAAGAGDPRTKEGVLDGRAATIFEILTAGEEEEARR